MERSHLRPVTDPKSNPKPNPKPDPKPDPLFEDRDWVYMEWPTLDEQDKL